MEFSCFWLLLLLYINVSLARKRLLKVDVVYSADGSLDGLGCAIHDPYAYNAARFDKVTKTCTPLPRTWYHTPGIQLPDNNYFQLVELEVLDPQPFADLFSNLIWIDVIMEMFMWTGTGVEKLELFPAILLSYGGVVLYVTTTDNPTGQNSYGVEFLDGSTTTFVEVPKTTGRCFASQINPYACTSFSMVNPYTDYALKYRIMDYGIQMYTDDYYDFDFDTGYSMERHITLRVTQGYGIVCKRIIFIFV